MDIWNACGKGNLKRVRKFLLTDSTIINRRDYYGYTPLHDACYYRRSKCVKFLLDNGADINSKNIHGNTPLYYACDFGHSKCLKLLLKIGGRIIIRSYFPKRIKSYLTFLESKKMKRISLPFLILLDLFIY